MYVYLLYHKHFMRIFRIDFSSLRMNKLVVSAGRVLEKRKISVINFNWSVNQVTLKSVYCLQYYYDNVNNETYFAIFSCSTEIITPYIVGKSLGLVLDLIIFWLVEAK